MTGPQDTGTDTGEMLELIAKVTADISDRMDAQGRTLAEIHTLAKKTGKRIAPPPPSPPPASPELEEKNENMAIELEHARDVAAKARERIAHAERQASTARGQVGTLKRESGEYRELYAEERSAFRAWRYRLWFPFPIIVLLLGLILPTFLGRHSLTCTFMQGTWHIEDGKAYCFFRRTAP